MQYPCEQCGKREADRHNETIRDKRGKGRIMSLCSVCWNKYASAKIKSQYNKSLA